jgi:hypothetical protein
LISIADMTGATPNSVEIIPPGVLEHVGPQLGCAPPRLASIAVEPVETPQPARLDLRYALGGAAPLGGGLVIGRGEALCR